MAEQTKKQQSTSGGSDSETGNGTPINPGIRSATPENSQGKINPSAPGNTGTTPGTNAKE